MVFLFAPICSFCCGRGGVSAVWYDMFLFAVW